jgi:uncharacterized Zn finger protein
MSKQAKKGYQDLTWFDLESWAGARIVSRGKSYQRGKSVRNLAITAGGELLAWVQGSATYATKVSLDKTGLSSVCTCPYLGTCKHAVAVVLEYLDCLEKGRNVIVADENDKRLMLIDEEDAGYPDEEDDDLSDEETDLDDEDVAEPVKHSARSGFKRSLEQRTKEELLALIEGVAQRHPAIRGELSDKRRAPRVKASALVKVVEKEIARASSEPGWQDPWRRRGYIPDYSRVQAGLLRLLDEGHADDVVRLGGELLSAGTAQVEQSDDEGETGEEIAESMAVVFKALAKSSLPVVDRMERTVDFGLRDEYGLCKGLEDFWKGKFAKSDWGCLADRLLARLEGMKSRGDRDSHFSNYRRDNLTDEIIRALDNAGREGEVIPLCMKEASRTQSYLRLVKRLRQAGRIQEAEEWIRKGISATSEKLPGTAATLRRELLDMRSRRRDWPFVAALSMDELLEGPSLQGYRDLEKACEKAKVWQPVRDGVLQFLTTGSLPWKGWTDWPLPSSGLETSPRVRHGGAPDVTTLIEIAIYERRIDDVLEWYHVARKSRQGWTGDRLHDSVATAVAERYPERAVSLWQGVAEAHISRVNVASYGEGARYLRKAQKVLLEHGKAAEWEAYLCRLKEENRRRPRLVEILDGLSQKPILRSGRKSVVKMD